MIGNQPKTRWWYLKCVIVYLARDIPVFVMYCVNGESGSSLLIESTDSDNYHYNNIVTRPGVILVLALII